MSSSDKNPVAPAPQEIDTNELDQVVGAGVVVHDRKQEQSEKVTVEQSEQK